ncbi:UNVERIFIED_CONTAM: hypothetical protein PYX00_000652 [Menopon gallinae]|uniref:Uncharacterized protein n=1 Tax=Menopon gallinae TaxID=328185 RepID=A0AAW2I9X7_9NEOP
MLSSSLSAPVRAPRRRPNKVLFYAWVWYAVIVSTAYVSSMKSKLTVPLRHKDIDTIQELYESNLELYGVGTSLKIVYYDNEDPIQKVIGKRAKPTNSSIDTIVPLILKRKVAYLRECTTFEYYAYSNRDAIGKLHRMKYCAYPYYPSLFLQKRCPVTHRVNRIVERLREAGILHFWRSLFLRENPQTDPAVVKLTMEHMTAPFLAFGIGLIVATLAFIAENSCRINSLRTSLTGKCKTQERRKAL